MGRYRCDRSVRRRNDERCALSRFWEQHPLLGAAGFAHKIEQLEDKDCKLTWLIIRCVLASVCGFVPAGVTFRRECRQRVMLDPDWRSVRCHPTTSLCLQWLDGSILNGKTVIDFGWVVQAFLAIAALKLGAKQRRLVADIDPASAIQASRDNAERNGASDRLELYLPKRPQPEAMKADVVVANILGRPITRIRPANQRVPPVEGNCWPGIPAQPCGKRLQRLRRAFTSTRSSKKKSGAALPAVCTILVSVVARPRFSNNNRLEHLRHRDIIKFIK